MTVTQPPSAVGTDAYAICPCTSQCGTPSSNTRGRTPKLAPSIVTMPSGLRCTTAVSAGISSSCPSAASRASRSMRTASLDAGVFFSANPMIT